MIRKNITVHTPAEHSENVAAFRHVRVCRAARIFCRAARYGPALSVGERSMKAAINGSKARLAAGGGESRYQPATKRIPVSSHRVTKANACAINHGLTHRAITANSRHCWLRAHGCQKRNVRTALR